MEKIDSDILAKFITDLSKFKEFLLSQGEQAQEGEEEYGEEEYGAEGAEGEYDAEAEY